MRYGLKLKIHVPAGLVFVVLFACCAIGLMTPAMSSAQSDAPLFSAAPAFDWSDYRATAKGRLFLARLDSLSISGTNFGTEITGQYLSNDTQLFKQIVGTLYVDRLGLRICAEQATVGGRDEISRNYHHYPELDIGPTRLGLDLDIIRYPFLKLGCNLDVGLQGVTLRHFRLNPAGPAQTVQKAEYRSDAPITIGIHAQAIPFRLKEVPAIFMARVRCPISFLEGAFSAVGLKQLAEVSKVKVFDWEVSAGLRPAVWETSFFGHSTFSFAIEVGYRGYFVDTPLTSLPLPPPFTNTFPPTLDMRARWQGVFFQAQAFF